MTDHESILDRLATGKLSESEQELVAEKLKEKGAGSAKCELCNNDKWIVGEYIVTPLGIARRGNFLAEASNDPFHPSFLVICDNCGNTKIININVLGLDKDIYEKRGNKK